MRSLPCLPLLFLLLPSVLTACSDGTPPGQSEGSGGSSAAGGSEPTAGGGFEQGTGGGSAGTGAAAGAGGSGGMPFGGGGSGGGSDNAGGAAGAAVGGSGGSSSGGGAGSGSGGGPELLGTFPPPDCGAPPDLGVRIVGRHDGCDSSGVRFSWSGSGFVARINGEGLRMTYSGNAVQFTVVVDGEVQSNLEVTSGDATYDVATGLAAGEHLVEVYRRGEAHFGPSVLRAVEVPGGTLLEPPAAPERRIEVFGDSITCGYGNEGTSASCPFSADTENHYLTYGALLARQLGAELSTVAWSGKGVSVNYGGDASETLTDMLDRAVPTSSSSVWDFTLAPPVDLVIINLGTNDYSTENDPTDGDFVSDYEQMLATLRERYPGAFILCTVGPLLSGSDLETARANIEAAVNSRKQAGDTLVQAFAMTTDNPDPGCDWHPSIATHEAMANELIGVVSSALGW